MQRFALLNYNNINNIDINNYNNCNNNNNSNNNNNNNNLIYRGKTLYSHGLNAMINHTIYIKL